MVAQCRGVEWKRFYLIATLRGEIRRDRSARRGLEDPSRQRAASWDSPAQSKSFPTARYCLVLLPFVVY